MVVGCDLALEEVPQLFVPGGTFHTSRLVGAGKVGYASLASTEWPGVKPGVEHGEIDGLVAAFPDCSEEIRAFTG